MRKEALTLHSRNPVPDEFKVWTRKVRSPWENPQNFSRDIRREIPSLGDFEPKRISELLGLYGDEVEAHASVVEDNTGSLHVLENGLEKVVQWLKTPPIHFDTKRIFRWFDQMIPTTVGPVISREAVGLLELDEETNNVTPLFVVKKDGLIISHGMELEGRERIEAQHIIHEMDLELTIEGRVNSRDFSAYPRIAA